MGTSLDSILEILQMDPPKYTPVLQKRDTKDNNLLDVLCTVINRLITSGDKIKNDRREFYPPNRKPPTIGIDAYLARLLKYSPCSKECFVMSLVYIDRFLRKCDLIINSMNIHRIVITSLLISTKYLDDIFYNNEFYSQVGGISLREMNGLEVIFLSMMNYTVNCSLDEFEIYAREVDKVKKKYEEINNQQALMSSASTASIPQTINTNPNASQQSSSMMHQQSPAAVVPHNNNNSYQQQTVPQHASSSSSNNNTNMSNQQQQQQQQLYNNYNHLYQQQSTHSSSSTTSSSSSTSSRLVFVNNQPSTNSASSSTSNNYQPYPTTSHHRSTSSSTTAATSSSSSSSASNNTASNATNSNNVSSTVTTGTSANANVSIPSRRRGSCDQGSQPHSKEQKTFPTGWVA